MDTLIRGALGALKRLGVVVGCLALALPLSYAQKRPVPNSPNATREVLAQKARALELRGRPDMAIQLWQQILLSDPKNADALAGMAKDYKLIDLPDKSGDALERLRRANPNDPNIAKIESLTSTSAQSDQLRQAGELARQGKQENAMRIYRSLYGDHPPDGDIALAYYQTLYGTAMGKETAIAAMRALAQRNPGDTRFAVELGTMLTYESKTRPEGIRILEEHSKEGNAQEALRQALIWDAANPSSAAELRHYLKDHPQDRELAARLKENESKLAQMNSGIARTPAEREAFAALNAHRLDEARKRFDAILQAEPLNGRAAAGMGFLRMQQSNFGGAISFLTQAEQNGYKAAAVEQGLATSRFWYTMGEASQALDENLLDLAAAKYQAALTMRPRSPEALNGLAGLLTKEQQFASAAAIYEQLLKVEPRSNDAWRGLFLAYARDGQNQKALALPERFPVPVKAAMAKDPEYLRTLATLYRAENRPVEAQRVLAQALALPFPDNGATLKADVKLQYAGILMEAKRFDQAAQMYSQTIDDDAGNLPAWMGIVSAHHEMGLGNQCIADVEKMPPATYEAALADPGFLSLLGAIYQQANQFEIAQGFLERSVKMQLAAGGQPSLNTQLQLAGIYLRRNNTAQAYAIYRRVLVANPDRADAWKGLISTLQATNRTSEALQQIGVLPVPVRRQLDSDIEFLQTEASLYAAKADTARATEYMNRVMEYYAALKTEPPANIAIQDAWLLFNTKNDRLLYLQLMRLGGRGDLTNEQRETVQTIWANWSVRRASVAMDNGNSQRAVDILDAASQAFPDNLTVRKAVAGGYVQVGRAKESLAIFKTVPMQDANAGDFQGAVGAALAANDHAQAEIWLRQALERFPHDPGILAVAARFEQARGDNERAAEYWRASLAAMPQVSPTDKLAHALVNPDQDTHAHRAYTEADLQHLLDPNVEPFEKTTKTPPLPAYGPDPYNGSAPVVLPQPALQQSSPIPQTTRDAPFSFPSGAGSEGKSPQGTAPANGPIYIPQSAPRNPTAGQPVFIQQKTTRPTANQPLTGKAEATRQTDSGSVAKTPPSPSYTGRMNLPASEENIESIDAGLRVSAQPMEPREAQAVALFAEQTDSQLTQGPAAQIHLALHAPTPPAARSSTAPAPSIQFALAQYTPSAQEAASGANPAPKQQTATQQTKQPPAATPPPTTPAKKPKKAAPATSPATPTLESAPAAPQIPERTPSSGEIPAGTSPAASSTGLSDEQLEQRNLPPLRGPWVRVQRENHPVSPRDEAEMQLRSIESGYSGWLGDAGIVNYRSGNLGYDHLAALESPFEASTPLGFHSRLTIVAKPVFLDSGQADGNAIVTVQESTTAGSTLVTIPEPIGTLTTTDTTPPAQQNAVGIGGEVQLAFPHLAIAGGYTPAGFLVATITGRAMWKPGSGPFTFNFFRDSVRDTQLSYAGLRDPAGNSLGNAGQVWGGVTANQGTAQFARGDAESGFYFGGGVQYLAGYHVETNSRIEGSGGAYWRVLNSPEIGTLSIGANFFGMHYAHNEDAFTLGMGGYFSPQAYFLGNVPFTWNAHYGTRWHYNLLGSLGVQAFQESLTPLYPMAAQAASEIALNNPMLPAKTSVGPNYDVRGQGAYQIGPHWFAGGFLSANNSRNYSAVSAGFSVRYLFRPQPSTVTSPTGLFPSDGLRPFTVP